MILVSIQSTAYWTAGNCGNNGISWIMHLRCPNIKNNALSRKNPHHFFLALCSFPPPPSFIVIHGNTLALLHALSSMLSQQGKKSKRSTKKWKHPHNQQQPASLYIFWNHVTEPSSFMQEFGGFLSWFRGDKMQEQILSYHLQLNVPEGTCSQGGRQVCGAWIQSTDEELCSLHD